MGVNYDPRKMFNEFALQYGDADDYDAPTWPSISAAQNPRFL